MVSPGSNLPAELYQCHGEWRQILWISFAPVADVTASFFKCSLDVVNYLSLVYLIIAIPVGFGASWLIDTLGLKCAIIFSSWLNMIGSIIRCAAVVPYLNPSGTHTGIYYLFTGQSLCAIAQPLVLFVPAKLAAVWFPDHQRATANMIASMANPLGVLLANVISPIVVTKEEYITHMLGIYAVPAVAACVLATAGIREKSPPTPPSASAFNTTSEPFISGIKQLVTNKAYIILMLCFGAGIGIFTAISSFLEQILCFRGYSNLFAGVCGALLIFFGFIGALVCGLYVDRTKKFKEVVKICFALTALTSIAFALVINFRDQTILVACACSLLGLFGFAISPIAMELAVECSYPVGEGSSTGLAFISGQIQGIIYMILFQKLTRPFAPSEPSPCGIHQTEIYDWSISMLVMAALCTFGSCIFIIFFHTDYKRLRAERNLNILKEELDGSAT
ncbi:major facilitator superfamily domain containing protein 7 isoform X2 [Xenopus laevis]|uniref:Major facilitator superfamily domain containing protein 7 isoform X2 n=1 Tax=Xenopus laevis TaxID=8355 RepID=A0A8J0TUZ2_XENLA|nr:major facilitator superfamily domain containing protein 7 isoform X2 [Xenopus laevis]